jgi:hypothetical protein
MLLDRGVSVDHTTIFRWIQAYAAELEKRIRPHLRMSNGSWRVDETYVKVKGRWIYLYRAVDSRGQKIAFLLSAKRDAEAAKRFFRKALAQPHTVNPRTITVGKNFGGARRIWVHRATCRHPVDRIGFRDPEFRWHWKRALWLLFLRRGGCCLGSDCREGAGHGLNRSFHAGRSPVAQHHPRGVVVGQPDMAFGILPN